MQQEFFNEACTEQTHEATLQESYVGGRYFVILLKRNWYEIYIGLHFVGKLQKEMH